MGNSVRFSVFTSLLAASAFALPAMAQGEAVTVDPLEIDAPTLSETDAAVPDWYRQFTIAAPPETLESNPALQSGLTEEFSFNFSEGTRWRFSIDLTTRPDDSVLPREEMSAGATFQITPRFSVGGDVSVGADELEDRSDWTGEDVETGVRLRSAFRF
ncbi:MAG: NtrZ family periplasmic regulatory protein [Pseudomonadota bacterium]